MPDRIKSTVEGEAVSSHPVDPALKILGWIVAIIVLILFVCLLIFRTAQLVINQKAESKAEEFCSAVLPGQSVSALQSYAASKSIQLIGPTESEHMWAEFPGFLGRDSAMCYVKVKDGLVTGKRSEMLLD